MGKQHSRQQREFKGSETHNKALACFQDSKEKPVARTQWQYIWEKILFILTKDWYPDSVKNSYNSNTRETTQLRMGDVTEQTLHNRYMKGQQKHEQMLNVINHQRYAN